uniref:Type VI secretion system baseplate subunit TssF n=1 Tax=Schistocephalus solidus TaxID=70667 RepID=A0A183SUD2_SCHSO
LLRREEACKPAVNREYVDIQGTVVTVDEFYQLGIQHNSSRSDEPAEVYLFDFVDTLSVSYPVNLSCMNSQLLENLPPFFHGPLYEQSLSTIASSVLQELAFRLESWMDALDQHEQEDFISRHLAAYDELTVLRRQFFTLLKHLVPNIDLSETFDPTSSDLDRLLLRIINELTSSGRIKRQPDQSIRLPLVSLCPEPEHCVEILRRRIFTVNTVAIPRGGLQPAEGLTGFGDQLGNLVIDSRVA